MVSFHSLLCASLAVFGAVDFADAAQFRPRDADKWLMSAYDYLIVGGGASGMTVARRLAETPGVTVLVIEAGWLDNNRDLNRIANADLAVPGYTAQGTPGKAQFSWNMTTTPQEFLSNRVVGLGQGTGIGGGSIVNGMVWTRGARSDFDAWAALGNTGWGWDDLLPYFKKSETFSTNVSPDDAAALNIQADMSNHGTSGPIQVSYANYHYDQNVNFLQGWGELGLPINPDMNSGTASGVAIGPYSMDAVKQTRSDARTAHFDFIWPRGNIHIFTNMRVTNLVLAPNTGSGSRRVAGINIQAERDGKVYSVKAKKEVIMAAGAIFTPTLLQLSGIGNPVALQRLGIPVQVAAPGVGFNLQDHPTVGVGYTFGNDNLLTSAKLAGTPLGTQYLNQYVQQRTGPYTLAVVNAVAFPPLKALVSDAMDWVSRWVTPAADNIPVSAPAAVKAGYAAQKALINAQLQADDVGIIEVMATSSGGITVATQKVFSRGVVVPKTNNIWDGPAANPRYCSNTADCEILALAIQATNKLVKTQAFNDLQVQIPAAFDTDDRVQLLKQVRARVSTEFHPSGSAAMMPQNLGGVVDTNLKVYGLCNLRIVDASIMPIIPSAHLQAGVYAVAEKAADLIKAGGFCSA